MNCRDFLNEFEERNALSDTATLHLNDCVDCRKLNAIQTRVWRVIDGFEPVDAPNDFDFHVKARIANVKSSDFQPQFFPALRYVLGLSVVGLILAFLVFNGVYSLDDKTVPAIAESNFQTPIQKGNPSAKPSAPEQIVDTNVPQLLADEKLSAGVPKQKSAKTVNKKQLKVSTDETLSVAIKSAKKPQIKTARDKEKNSGGSQVLAVSTPRIIMPKGTDSTKKIETLPNDGNANAITAEQILLQLGVEIALENGRQQVKKITQNSVAERSGVKVGDLIEAIDGEKLTGEPIRAKTIEGKKLTIVRGAEKIEISLRN